MVMDYTEVHTVDMQIDIVLSISHQNEKTYYQEDVYFQ